MDVGITGRQILVRAPGLSEGSETFCTGIAPSPMERALNHATLTELRKRGVAAVQSGESPTQVAAALGVHRRSLFRWLALYRRGGWDQLDARKRGGRPPKLDGRALRWIYHALSSKNPQ
jgi:hypothetical protein